MSVKYKYGTPFSALVLTGLNQAEIKQVNIQIRDGILQPRYDSQSNVIYAPGMDGTLLPEWGIARLDYIGMCKTTAEMLQDGLRFKNDRLEIQSIPGHEGIATIVATGSVDYKYLMDKKVFMGGIVGCYGLGANDTCRYCTKGDIPYHEPFIQMGVTNDYPGQYSQYMVVHLPSCVPINDLSPEKSSLLELLACINYSLRRVTTKTDFDYKNIESAVVLGSGAAGIMTAQLLQYKNGEMKVTVIDPDSSRLTLAKNIGIQNTLCLNDPITTQNIVDLLGENPQLVYNACPDPNAIGLSLVICDKQGYIIDFGLGRGSDIMIPDPDLNFNQKGTIYIPSIGPGDRTDLIQAVQQLGDGIVRTQGITGDKIRGWNNLIKALRDHNNGFLGIKPIFYPN